ncbi:molybdopterin-dependent oxidoreductase alpha subunit [Sphingobium xenophagum]|uniref:Molybdopterin-dependent oxidoreductase alpha subunit n=1 Tax=Sphingobium xenophagum TaxID=121428 RepID=A0ABU1X7H1_SPHXE|nr:FdhF/YdeP family oxidoreductase [Sphingobium xenophagum]MDR7157051.1 molybdopterin-dependent oxidoreductase alpha subunit [Sphingobium xenophagum]
MTNPPETVEYDNATGGWGSLRGMGSTALGEKSTPGALETLRSQNKTGGFMCTSCAWGKPKHPHAFEFCENGAKATLWELTTHRCTPEFFAKHSVTELRGWSDHDLEHEGRLTHPMRYDAASDHYVLCGWEEAFSAIGAELEAIDPKSAIFYASGRASLETSYLYALFARLYGHNNLPDSSNMCHETTSVTLNSLIGSPVGTCVLDDFVQCDAIFFFGQNTGTNSPRFLHPLQKAVERGCKVVTFNPIREKGLIEFVNPQRPTQMLTGNGTQISCQYLQVRAGGDIAAIMGLCKYVLAEDARRGGTLIDRAFIAEHCLGFEAFRAKADATTWDRIEQESGLSRADIEEAGRVYVEAERVIGVYGMGLTQHVHGFENIAMLVNLLLMRGHIGRPGAGICPVRGHSNVQGQRTVGISEKPELVPLDKFAEQFDFDPPRDKGMTTVEVCEGVLDGSVQAFIGLGGNFLRAIPDQARIEPAWEQMRLTVQIATKLNRGHLFNGKIAYLLPCLGRSEEDMQAGGPQTVTIEDSFSHIHASIGHRKPASEHLKSEMAIVAGIAKATLPPNPKVRWDEWTADYSLVRDLIAETYHEEFHDMNARIFEPGGFYRGNGARERIWKTESGKAQFTAPDMLAATDVADDDGRYRLVTVRSNDQFNTTIYGYSDRLRGIEGKRNIVLINPADMARAGLTEGQRVSLTGDAGDSHVRRIDGLEIIPFDLPDGTIVGYYPELNPLIALHHHDRHSKTPASKAVPVRIEPSAR